ncbi:MAG: aminodeoxychorismate lyase [Flavobacteriales bacterium]|nr:aminodeoxychorismate lyase [Flavobacteriales bacterium]
MKKESNLRIIIGLVITIFFTISTILSYNYYITFHADNTIFKESELYFYVPTGSDFLTLKKQITTHLKDSTTFLKASKKKNFVNNVKPGKYVIKKGFSNIDIINSFKFNNIPVKVTFNNIQRLEDFASKISNIIEPDSLSLMKSFLGTDFLLTNQLTSESVFAIFIPNTYEFYWNSSPDFFRDRMFKYFNSYWNPERLRKAKLLNLSPIEVSVLASIVQRETPKVDERPTISGVYYNRILKNMKLQADPTVIYTIKQKKGFDTKIRRVLYRDLRIDSPYNTYKYRGLPPGPIYMADISSIESVLNLETHEYLFFVADVSRPGYHMFAKNLYQHNRNKRQYTNWLRKNKIKR